MCMFAYVYLCEKYTHTHTYTYKVGGQLDLSLIEDNPLAIASFSLDVLFKALVYSMYDILLSLTVHPAGSPIIFAQEGMS